MTSAENPHAGQGAVLLDIGGDVGALVVTMPAGMVGTEVEIRPVGVAHSHPHGGHEHVHHGAAADAAHLAHVAVVARPVGDGTVPSLVFGDLDGHQNLPKYVTAPPPVSGVGVTTRCESFAEVTNSTVVAIAQPMPMA